MQYLRLPFFPTMTVLSVPDTSKTSFYPAPYENIFTSSDSWPASTLSLIVSAPFTSLQLLIANPRTLVKAWLTINRWRLITHIGAQISKLPGTFLLLIYVVSTLLLSLMQLANAFHSLQLFGFAPVLAIRWHSVWFNGNFSTVQPGGKGFSYE